MTEPVKLDVSGTLERLQQIGLGDVMGAFRRQMRFGLGATRHEWFTFETPHGTARVFVWRRKKLTGRP